MPATRSTIFGSMNRFSPLAKANYTIPPSLPAPYGVTGLYNWSAPAPSSRASSMPATPASLSISSYTRSVEATKFKRIIDSPPPDTPSDVVNLISPSCQVTPLPLFRPPSSPTPIKRGSSGVSLLLSNSSSCLKLHDKSMPLSSKGSTGSAGSSRSFYSARTTSGLSSQSAPRLKTLVKHTNPPPSTLSSSEESEQEESDDDQDLEGFVVPDSPESSGDDLTNSGVRMHEELEESEEDSEDETPPACRTKIPRLIDDSAKVSKPRHKAKSSTNGGKNEELGTGVDDPEGSPAQYFSANDLGMYQHWPQPPGHTQETGSLDNR
ncbi:hypothetical protein FRC11_010755, partial [Ceratobasidium sp. 423]